MGQLLDWYSKFNSSIIQSLSVVIGGLLVFFIFRLFFIKEAQRTKASSANSSGAVLDEDQIEHRTQQILSEQKQKKSEPSESLNQNANLESLETIDKLQIEVFNLKQTLKEIDSKSKSTSTESSAVQTLTQAVDVTEYQKQIDDLKNRLSDYEVIADDIADLHKLREENKKLLQQIKNPTTQVLDQLPNADIENLIQNLTDDLVVTDKSEVSAEDKDLMQQFEKSKGSI